MTLLSLLSLPPGRERYMVVCPLPGHTERTASCAVSKRGRDGRWRWHCFGCGEGGDAIDLLRLRDGMTYAQARAATGEGQGDGSKYKPQPRGRRDASRAAPAAWVLVCDACQLERCDLDSAERLGWEVGACADAAVGPDCLERAARRRLGLPELGRTTTLAVGTCPVGTDPCGWVTASGAVPFLLHAGSFDCFRIKAEILLHPGIDRPATERFIFDR